MKFLVNVGIQSVSDVITNSSSELYLVNLNNKSNDDINDVMNYIETRCRDFYKTNEEPDNLFDIAKKIVGLENVDVKKLTQDQRNRIFQAMVIYRRENLVECSSGMGGDLEICRAKDLYDEYVKHFSGGKAPMTFHQWINCEYPCYEGQYKKKDTENPENILIIDIDYARYASINFLEKEFNAKKLIY